jgi:tetratricopeptide (TPR) repeat protein
MEPFDTIDRIRIQDNYTSQDIRELKSLTQFHPNEPELWDVLGDIIQACDEDRPIEESIACYKRAIECEVTYAPAYESIAWAMDTYFNDFDGAENNFLTALQHGASDTARIGLSRVLAQRGRTNEAIAYLDSCQDQTHPDVTEMRRQIVEGIWFSESQDTA